MTSSTKLAVKASPSETASCRVLSTQSVPAERRLEYWVEMVCSLYCKLECTPSDTAPIHGDIRFRRLGDGQFTQVRSNCKSIRLLPHRIAQCTDDHYLVLVMREGLGTLTQGSRTAQLRPGDFAVHDCTRPYELHFDGPVHALDVLRLARADLESHISDPADLTASTVPGEHLAGRLLKSMIESIGDDEVSAGAGQCVSQALTSIVAAGLRSLPAAGSARPKRLADYHRARVRTFVRDRLRDPQLSVGMIAAATGLSADYLGKLFRDEPEPLSRWIWRLRLDACRRDLCDGRFARQGISEIAFSWGFNDAAHFSRSFRDRFGLSPRELRMLSGVVPGEARQA